MRPAGPVDSIPRAGVRVSWDGMNEAAREHRRSTSLLWGSMALAICPDTLILGSAHAWSRTCPHVWAGGTQHGAGVHEPTR